MPTGSLYLPLTQGIASYLLHVTCTPTLSSLFYPHPTPLYPPQAQDVPSYPLPLPWSPILSLLPSGPPSDPALCTSATRFYAHPTPCIHPKLRTSHVTPSLSPASPPCLCSRQSIYPTLRPRPCPPAHASVNQIRVILPFGLFIRSADQQRPNIIVTLTSRLHYSPFYLFGFSTSAACFQSDHSLAKIGSL